MTGYTGSVNNLIIFIVMVNVKFIPRVFVIITVYVIVNEKNMILHPVYNVVNLCKAMCAVGKHISNLTAIFPNW